MQRIETEMWKEGQDVCGFRRACTCVFCVCVPGGLRIIGWLHHLEWTGVTRHWNTKIRKQI